MKKNLWFSTALFIAMMGTAAPAPAQQYLERYKVTDKPSVEVDMGALASAPPSPAEPAAAVDPAANAAPLPQVDQQELMRAATEDTPDKTLDKPFFTAMTPAAQTEQTEATQANAPETAATAPAPVITTTPKHHMAIPPKPRHKPRTATMTATAPEMPAVKPTPVEATPLEKRPSLVNVPMLSLPSHMPPLAIDNAQMPPIATAPPVVPAPQPAYGLTQDESKSVPVAVEQEPAVAPPTAPTAPETAQQQDNNNLPPNNVALPMDMPTDTTPPDNDNSLTAAQAADAKQSMQKALQPSDTPTPVPAAPQGTVMAPGPVAAVDAAPGDDMPVVPKLSDLTLLFSGNSSDLSPDAQKKLNSLVAQLRDMTGGRIQVRGFATGEDGGQASARRISLSRVLSVRSYLMDKGIKPTRVDVRAQGSETDRTPLDRVDLLFER